MRKSTVGRQFGLSGMFTLLLLVVASVAAPAQTIYGLARAAGAIPGPQRLISFDASAPGTTISSVAITGIVGSQELVGLDSRPATGELFTLGYDPGTQTARLYTLDPATGAAAPVGASDFSIDLGVGGTGNVGFDFNPTVDRIRVVVADNNNNYRLNPATGAVAVVDTDLSYAPGDPNAAVNPNVSISAYTNSYLGATSTTLYDVDFAATPTPGVGRLIFSIQNPPNAGVLNTVAEINPSLISPTSDMDVYANLTSGSQTAYMAAAQTTPGATSDLYAINLTSGGFTLIGQITGWLVSDVAAQIVRPNPLPPVTGRIIWALTPLNTFVTFDSNNPTLIRSIRTITGIVEPQIAGFDTRPATGELFALGYDPGSEAARLYTINLGTGAATAVGAGPVTLTGMGASVIGFDFNPTVDRIRVVGTSDKNFRLNPNDGTIAATDTNLAYAPGDPNNGTDPNIGSAGYTNSFAGSSTTTLYVLDEALGTLNTQVPPNAGTLNTVGSLGLTLNPSDVSIDLDIFFAPGSPGVNTAFLSANPNGTSSDNLYTVNLTTGAATLAGRIGGGIAVRDIAIRTAPPVTWVGATDSNYGTAANWSNNAVPTTATPVIIPAETPFSPNVSDSQGAGTLTIAAGATFTVQPGGVLQLNATLTNNGTFDGQGDGRVSLIGPGTQTLGGTGSTTFGDLTVGAASLANAARVRQRLTLNGSLTTNGNTLTLLSDANATAMVINNGGTVIGTTTVQRYLDPSSAPGLGYRHFSAPVVTTFADLMASGFTPIVNAAYNTAPNPLAVSPYPNIFGYNEALVPSSSNFSRGYFSPMSLADPMVLGRGYSVYMAGTVKPDFVGTLNNGPVAVTNLTKTGNFNLSTQKSGWHLLGNPYPSPIDWDLITVPAGMSPTVSVYRSTGGANGTYTQYINGVGAPGTDLIPSAQGFFVRVLSGAPLTLTFDNAARVTTYANPSHFRAAPDTRPTAHLTLRRADQPLSAADEAWIYFQDGATAGTDLRFDADKLRAEGQAASIFSLAAGAELAINGLPAEQMSAASVALGVVLPVAGTYELSAAALRGFGANVTLVDHLTGTEYDLTQQPTVRFTAYRPGEDLTRFALRFGRGAANAVALNTLSLNVYPNPATANTDALRVNVAGATGATVDATLFDVLGRAVVHQTLPVRDQLVTGVLSLRALTRGTYVLRVAVPGSPALTRKVVVE